MNVLPMRTFRVDTWNGASYLVSAETMVDAERWVSRVYKQSAEKTTEVARRAER